MPSRSRVFWTPRGQGAERRIAETRIDLRVENLAGAARIGVRILLRQRHAVVVNLRPDAVAEPEGARIETGFGVEDDGRVREERLFALDADDRLAEAVRREQGLGSVAVLHDQFFDAGVHLRIPRHAVAFVPDAHVVGAVQRDAVAGQRAGRVEEVDRAVHLAEVQQRAAGRGRRRDGRRLLGRQISGLRAADKKHRGRRSQEQISQKSHSQPRQFVALNSLARLYAVLEMWPLITQRNKRSQNSYYDKM